MLTYNTAVVLIGAALLSATSGVVGALAVLRQRALTGDALAHAALPGVWIGFLLAGERSLPFMLGGALAAGMLGVVLISWLPRVTRLREDAVIGSVLGVFFGVGIALASYVQQNFPGGNKAGVDTYLLGKAAAMTRDDVYLIAAAAIVCLSVITLLYKEFKLTSFDPGFGAAIGWPVGWIDFALLALVAVAVIASLPTVGVVLAAAVLILPGSAARFWTNRLSVLLLIAGLFGAIMGVVGTLASAEFAVLPTGPTVVLTGSFLFAVSLFLGSARGLLLGIGRRIGQKRRWEDENLLRQIWRGRSPPHLRSAAASRLLQRGLLQPSGSGSVALTEQGRETATELERNFLLWEALADAYPEHASSELDPHADRAHNLPPDLYDELVARLREQGRWPETTARTAFSQGGG